MTYISWFSEFALYEKDHLTYKHHTSRLWNGITNIWPVYECWSVWPIFNGPMILLYIWKTIWHMKIILPDYEMVLYYTVFHLSMTVSHCDLYFMVQWFCPVSERCSTDLFSSLARHNSGELCCHETALVVFVSIIAMLHETHSKDCFSLIETLTGV